MARELASGVLDRERRETGKGCRVHHSSRKSLQTAPRAVIQMHYVTNNHQDDISIPGILQSDQECCWFSFLPLNQGLVYQVSVISGQSVT